MPDDHTINAYLATRRISGNTNKFIGRDGSRGMMNVAYELVTSVAIAEQLVAKIELASGVPFLEMGFGRAR